MQGSDEFCGLLFSCFSHEAEYRAPQHRCAGSFLGAGSLSALVSRSLDEVPMVPASWTPTRPTDLRQLLYFSDWLDDFSLYPVLFQKVLVNEDFILSKFFLPPDGCAIRWS